MKVLVTGAGGFIASHPVERLVPQGPEAGAFVRYNSHQDPGLLLPGDVRAAVEMIAGDQASLICRVTGRETRVEVDPQRLRPATSEVRQLHASPARARALLGWSPSTDLETGLPITVDRFRENLGRYHPCEYAV